MTQIEYFPNGKKSLLTSNDVCLYCASDGHGNGIYYNKKDKYFFEYMRGLERDYAFLLSYEEAKVTLEILKPLLSKEQIEICKEIWSDF